MRILARNTKIKLNQIKDLSYWIEDQRYEIGQISQKTGLLKTAEGWVKPEKNSQKKIPIKSTWIVPRSLGAVAKRYTAKSDINVTSKNESYVLKEGSKVENIELIAKGHGIRTVSHLMEKYKKPNGEKTKATDWTKKKGIGVVLDKNGNQKKAELHWYECQGLGKCEFKVKRWNEEK